jgi:serine/threonine-protein kinase RsbW
MGGDLKLINLSPMVRNSLVTFTPNTYLSLETTENFALADFGETSVNDISFDENKTIDELNNEVKQKEWKKSDINFDKNDIVAELQTLTLNDSNKIRIGSSAENLYRVCDFVLERAHQAGFDEHELAKIKVTVYEASLNAIEHSYFSNPDYWIDVYAVEKNEKFYFIIHDWGRSFEFNPNRNYDVEMAVKERRSGGFGLHIIKRSVDEIYYLPDNKVGNRLVLIKKIEAETKDQ